MSEFRPAPLAMTANAHVSDKEIRRGTLNGTDDELIVHSERAGEESTRNICGANLLYRLCEIVDSFGADPANKRPHPKKEN